MMNWSARASLLPSGMHELAEPAFPVDGALPPENGAPWLPDELAALPDLTLEHETERVLHGDAEPEDEDRLAQSDNAAGSTAGGHQSSCGIEQSDGAAFSAHANSAADGGPSGSWVDREQVEARRIAEAQRAKYEAAVAAAYAEGYAAGEEAGRSAEGMRLAEALGAAERALDTIRNTDASWRGRLEENLCALAVGVAQQLLSRELLQDPSLVSALVRQALVEFPVDQPVSIRINPADLAVMTAQTIAGESTSGVAAGREARWVADPEIMPGDCVVEGRERIVDGRVDTALERMYRRLAEVTQ